MDKNEFSFGGISSKAFHITCDTETHSILPNNKRYVQEIPGLDGVIDYGLGGYETRILSVPLYYEGDYANLRKDRERIIAWLRADGYKKLVFGHSPDRYYLAKIYEAVDFSNTTNKQIGIVQFECNPPWQFLFDGTLLSPEQLLWLNCDANDNCFVKEFTEAGSMRFVNVGQPAKPVIKLIGNIHSGITLTYKETHVTIEADLINDGIAVDCNAETITRLSDRENLYPFLSEDSSFFELENGNVELSFSMEGLGEWPASVTVIVEMQVSTGG